MTHSQTPANQARATGPMTGRKVSAVLFSVLLAILIMLGTYMVVAGSRLASQPRLIVNETGFAPFNSTLSPGEQRFLMGEGGPLRGGSRYILCVIATSPMYPQSRPELRVNTLGAVNGTIFSAQGDFIETNFTVPEGTRAINFTIANPTSSSFTLYAVYVRLGYYDYPNSEIGSWFLYTGSAIIIASVVTLGVWSFRRTHGLNERRTST